MPTGVLSFGSIAQRLRAAADSSTLTPTQIEDLAACADTLAAGEPNTQQLRAIAKMVGGIAPIINDPAFWRCVSSVDYWITHPAKRKPAPAMKPDWMVHDHEAAIEAASAAALDTDVDDPPTLAALVKEMIDRILDRMVTNEHLNTDADDLDVLVDIMKRLA